MFVLTLTLVGTLLHVYLFWHLATLPWLRSGHRFRALFYVALLIWVVFAAGTVLGHDSGGGATALFERLAMDWFGLLFISATVLVVSDLLTLLVYRCARCRTGLRVGALSVSAVLVTFALIQGSRSPVVIEHEVAMPGLPAELDGLSVVALADLHLGSQLGAKWLNGRVEQVSALKPDLVVLLGDLFEGHGEPDPALGLVFSRLAAPLGVYAVTGNHEHFGDSSASQALTERAGVKWLRDDWVELQPGLVLAGVDDLTIRWRRGKLDSVITPLLESAPHGATILLSHSPMQVEQAAAAGAGLMLSGHTHGGQIWPFNYLVREFYPRLVGRFNVNGMTLLVSRGTGLWGPRMRLWQPGEILKITLHRAS